MVADGDRSGSQTVAGGERFALERFAWSAPDRLEVAGTFEELREPPSGEPALAIRGTGGWRLLPAVPESASGPPRAGEPWHATFAWEDAPTPFDAAQLTFGDDLYVRLPDPAAGGEPGPAPVLAVVRVGQQGGAVADGAAAGGGAAPSVREQVEHLRLQARLRAAQERIDQLEAAAERAAAELDRARADLGAERERRASDAQQFEEGLTEVREMAERSLAEARADGETLRDELETVRAALEQREAEHAQATAAFARQTDELDELRQRVDAAAADRQQLEDEAVALRARVAAIDRVHALAEDARASTRGALDRLDAMAEELDGHVGD